MSFFPTTCQHLPLGINVQMITIFFHVPIKLIRGALKKNFIFSDIVQKGGSKQNHYFRHDRNNEGRVEGGCRISVTISLTPLDGIFKAKINLIIQQVVLLQSQALKI